MLVVGTGTNGYTNWTIAPLQGTMTTYKPISEYSVEEVAVWVECIGLKSGPFKDNAVDGDMLCHLTPEDLTGDLGLSGLESESQTSKNSQTLHCVANIGYRRLH